LSPTLPLPFDGDNVHCEQVAGPALSLVLASATMLSPARAFQTSAALRPVNSCNLQTYDI